MRLPVGIYGEMKPMSSKQKKLGQNFEKACMQFARQNASLKMSVEFKTKDTQQLFGDFAYCSNGKSYRVDCKIEENAIPNFPVEDVQCLKDNSVGWIHHLQQCDEIWYAKASCDAEYKTATILDCWKILLPKLKAFPWRSFPRKVCYTGYGETVLHVVPLELLEQKCIAFKMRELNKWLNA